MMKHAQLQSSSPSRGKIVAAGGARDAAGSYDLALVRYSPRGELDGSFGANGNGIVTTSLADGFTFEEASAIATLADGTILVGGVGNDFILLMRYNANGLLDSTFGSNGNGIVTTKLDGMSSKALAVDIQADGKIVLAGVYLNAPDWFVALVRYSADGLLDSTFGDSGTFITHPPSSETAMSVKVQPDGKIVFASAVGRTGEKDDFAAARLNSDGSVDTPFGNQDLVTTQIGDGDDQPYAMEIQNHSKIVVAGHSTSQGIALARYNSASGSLNASFGNGGKVTTDIGAGTIDDEAHAMVI